ncbi:hypothetical protein MGN70_007523 [Eutypa lata]|nr:hypothetical protein MGN70_007523 [Eutypa lata]
MAEDRPRSGQFPPGDGKSANFLPSTFSPWGNYERISEDGGGDYHLDNIAADVSRPTTRASQPIGSPDTVSQVENGSPLSDQGGMPTPDFLITPPVPSQPFEGRQEPELPRQPEPVSRPAALPRKSKFREMLQKSLSSRKRAPVPTYESIRGMTEDYPYRNRSPTSIEREFARYDGLGNSTSSNDSSEAVDLNSLYCMSGPQIFRIP